MSGNSHDACHASGTCDAPPGCSEQMDQIAALPTTSPNQFRDYASCLNRSSPDFHGVGSSSPLNAYCAGSQCTRLADTCAKAEANGIRRLAIGVVCVDNRVQHSGAAMWKAYCIARGYTFIQLFPVENATAIGSPSRPNPIMLQDWNSNRQLIALLHDPTYMHLDYFMYTELDQWMVQVSRHHLHTRLSTHAGSHLANHADALPAP